MSDICSHTPLPLKNNSRRSWVLGPFSLCCCAVGLTYTPLPSCLRLFLVRSVCCGSSLDGRIICDAFLCVGFVVLSSLLFCHSPLFGFCWNWLLRSSLQSACFRFRTILCCCLLESQETGRFLGAKMMNDHVSGWGGRGEWRARANGRRIGTSE